jgi:hypothetical protein
MNGPNGKLDILGLPADYEPNVEYPIQVRLTHTWETPGEPQWGFQLTAFESDSGFAAGTFVAPAELQVIAGTGSYAARRYVEHNGLALHTGSPGPVAWSFLWRAPAYDAGPVYFFAAGNAANGDWGMTDDFIYTTADTVRPRALVSVPWTTDEGFELLTPAPNPFRRTTRIRFRVSTAGQTSLDVFDVIGRRVRTLSAGWHEAGSFETHWDGRNSDGDRLVPGVYFARLSSVGSGPTLVQRVVFSP